MGSYGSYGYGIVNHWGRTCEYSEMDLENFILFQVLT